MEAGQKGICRLSVVPVRQEGSDRSEQVSQLLFGDHYEVLEKEGNWLKIKIHFDGYEGWIDSNQFYAISDDYFNQINNSDYKIALDLVSSILFKKHPINIVMGSILPISTNELFQMEEQLAFNGESKSLSQRRDADFVLNTARKYINAPYQWGGRSPFGIDCSGFTQIVYRIAGYVLPRDSSEQAKFGQPVDLNAHKTGDLAFFAKEGGAVTHVGILMPDNKIIHASGKVRIDEIDERGIINRESGVVSHHYHSTKRIIRD